MPETSASPPVGSSSKRPTVGRSASPRGALWRGAKRRVAAVDLGATSGRVLVGTYAGGRLRVEETARFSHGPVAMGGDMVWDLPYLWRNILAGLRTAGPVDSIGVDSWAVDYARLDAHGRLLGLPESYRSPRTEGLPEDLRLLRGRPLFARNGVAQHPFNTLYQLVEDADQGRPPAHALALLPDLLAAWLLGRRFPEACEVTNASTTGLLDPRTRSWHPEVVAALEAAIPGTPCLAASFGTLVEPGTVLGHADPFLWGAESGAGASDVEREPSAQVIAVGSHDTASAVAAVPAVEGPFAYISSGTWSLVGVELTEAVCTPEAFAAGFTNELGVGGRVRFLTNVMGMWVQSQCFEQWTREGVAIPGWEQLDAAAESVAPRSFLMDLRNSVFFAPGNMTPRINAACREFGSSIPRTMAEYLRAIYDSLALAYARALCQAAALSGTRPEAVHIVGGGARNSLLCQATADATGLEVIAGPVEATALGNLGVQLQALGAIPPGLDALRRLVRSSCTLTTYRPRAAEHAAWRHLIGKDLS